MKTKYNTTVDVERWSDNTKFDDVVYLHDNLDKINDKLTEVIFNSDLKKEWCGPKFQNMSKKEWTNNVGKRLDHIQIYPSYITFSYESQYRGDPEFFGGHMVEIDYDPKKKKINDIFIE